TDALVGHGNGDEAIRLADADTHAATGRRVGDGVRDQVVHGDHEERFIPVDLGVFTTTGGEGDAGCLSGDAVLVNGLRNDPVDVEQLGRCQCVRGLKPGQVDDFAGDACEPGSLRAEACGELSHL